MPISATLCLLLLIISLAMKAATGYRGLSVAIVFLAFNTLSLWLTLIPKSLFITHWLWDFSPGLDLYYSGVLLVISAIGLVPMLLKVKYRTEAEKRADISITNSSGDITSAFYLLFFFGVAGAAINGWGFILTLLSHGVGALAIGSGVGAVRTTNVFAGLLSLPMYAAAILFGPYASIRRIPFEAIIGIVMIFICVAVIKDFSISSRGFTINVTLLLTFSLLMWRTELWRSLLVFSGVLGGFIILFSVGLILYRFKGNPDLVLPIAIDLAVGRIYGCWLGSSYIFDAFQGKSPIPGLLTFLGDTPMVGIESAFYFFYPVVQNGPWNSATAIAMCIQDFGMFFGAVVFICTYTTWILLEVYCIRSSTFFGYMIYNAMMPMAVLQIITLTIPMDPRFVIACILAWVTTKVFRMLRIFATSSGSTTHERA